MTATDCSGSLPCQPGRWALFIALVGLTGPAPGERPWPSAPSVLAVAADGSLVIAGLHQPGIFRRSPEGRFDHFAGSGSKPRSPLYAVSALAVASDGTVYAGDRATGEVYRVRPGSPPEPLTGGALEIPSGLAVGPQGDLIVCDLRLGLVARIPRQGGPPVTLARVAAPRGVALGMSGDLAVLSMGPDQVVRVGQDGRVHPLVKGKPFKFPIAILRDRDRKRYLISDSYAATIWSVDDTGAFRPWFRGDPLVRPEGLDFDSDGRLLVADPGAKQIVRFNAPDRVEPLIGKP